MKKIMIVLGLVLMMFFMVQAETKATQPVKIGTRTYLVDTLVGTDSIKVPLLFFTELQRGFYNFTYIVDSIDVKILGNGVKLYYEESMNTAYGWLNRTLIDSIVLPESTFVADSSYIHGTDNGQFVFMSDLTAATDTVRVILILQAIPK